VLRTGPHDENEKVFTDELEAKAYAQQRYDKARDPKGEILISGSDDLSLYMWQPKR